MELAMMKTSALVMLSLKVKLTLKARCGLVLLVINADVLTKTAAVTEYAMLKVNVIVTLALLVKFASLLPAPMSATTEETVLMPSAFVMKVMKVQTVGSNTV
jgi:hypothetical protein